MSREKKYNKAKGSTYKDAVIQSIKHDKKDIIIKLHFNEIDLLIQEGTNKALHEIKRVCNCTTAQAIAFLLNAGVVIFETIKSEFERINLDVRKKNESKNSS